MPSLWFSLPSSLPAPVTKTMISDQMRDMVPNNNQEIPAGFRKREILIKARGSLMQHVGYLLFSLSYVPKTQRMKQILPVVLISVLSLAVSGQAGPDTLKKLKIAVIPMINYNPSFGVNFGAMGQAFYKLNRNDTVSPSSSTGVFGMYTTNKTYFGAVFQRLYLREDNWRIMGAVGLGNINFQYWQELPVIGGDFICFSTETVFAMARVERRVYRKLYAGVNAVFSRARTEFL